MNYKAIYDSLINRARGRILEGYTERHHIQPKCMGGTDGASNLVILTAEEHFVAHQLLVKMYPSNGKLVYAANMMGNRTNKTYGWLRRKFAEEHSSNHKGWTPTDECRLKMSKAGRGRLKTAEHKQKIAKAHTKVLEYKGQLYYGAKDLQQKTKVSRHLYGKYYLNGIDPEPYIGNNLHGWERKRMSKKFDFINKNITVEFRRVSNSPAFDLRLWK